MTECYQSYGYTKQFGYKRNQKGKRYTGGFYLVETDSKFEIWGLSIMERYRNKGYGTRMLTEFLSQFSSDKPLVLYVHKTNDIAIHLYEKVGFAIVGDYSSYAYEMQYLTERK